APAKNKSPGIKNPYVWRYGNDRRAHRHQKREKQTRSSRSNLVDEQTSDKDGENCSDAVQSIHLSDRFTSHPECCDKRRCNGADAVVCKIASEGQQAHGDENAVAIRTP